MCRGTRHLATGVTPLAPANDDVPTTKLAENPRKKARGNIGALPKHLPRCEQVLEPDTTACPCCQGVLHQIGEDVSEVLDVIPAILRVLRTIRPKYACRGCTDDVVQAKVLPRLIKAGVAIDGSTTPRLCRGAIMRRSAGHRLPRDVSRHQHNISRLEICEPESIEAMIKCRDRDGEAQLAMTAKSENAIWSLRGFAQKLIQQNIFLAERGSNVPR